VHCVFLSYLTNRFSASAVRFRAGSSIRGSGGTVHPAAQLIADPDYDSWTIDFDVAVVRVNAYVCANLNFLQNHFKLGSNTLNETGNLVTN